MDRRAFAKRLHHAFHIGRAIQIGEVVLCTGKDFEDLAYPHATPETLRLLRHSRATIRSFLASNLGRSSPNQKLIGTALLEAKIGNERRDEARS